MPLKKFKTERMLLASIAVLFLFLFVSAFSKEVGTNVSLAEEESGASGSDSEEVSQKSEDSRDDEGSQEDEDSQDDEKSEPSVSSTPSVKNVKRTVVKTRSASESSEKSSDEASQQSVEEASEDSELSEESQELSEESVKYVEGYGEVVSKEGNVALVKKGEKLFFLIPVEVESQVTLDEQGTVVNTKKSFLNWVLSVLSF